MTQVGSRDHPSSPRPDSGLSCQDIFAFTPIEYTASPIQLPCGAVQLSSGPPRNLLASVYGQCWPPPGLPRRDCNTPKNGEQGLRKEWSSNVPPPGGRPTPASSRPASAALSRPASAHPNTSAVDQNTVKWRAWVGNNGNTAGHVTPVTSPGTQDDVSDGDSGVISSGDSQSGPAFENMMGDKIHLYPSLYKLTANEFRKLNENTRDAPPNGKIYRGSGYRQKVCTGRPGADLSALYRSQLATSLRAFNNKQYPPYDPDPGDYSRPHPRGQHPHPHSGVGECRPPRPHSSVGEVRGALRPPSSLSETRIQMTTGTTQSRVSMSPMPPRSRPRPQSCPPAHYELRVQGRGSGAGGGALTTSQGDFDSLTPEVVYALSDGVQPESVYGDRPASCLGQLEEAEETGSGSGDTEKDTDIDSDEEDYPEPDLDEAKLSRVPELHLRPEKLDAMHVPEYGKGDRRKYDFDATQVDTYPYEFAPVLPENMRALPVKTYSETDKNWRTLTEVRPLEVGVEELFDRLVELERLQLKTVEWETQKSLRNRWNRARLAARTRLGIPLRAPSAKNWREKKCCMDCLQVCCVGDCPTKPPTPAPASAAAQTCGVCGEKGCSGNCSESVYTGRGRAEREDDIPTPPLTPTPPRPRSCGPCQTRHTAKLINANYIISGRPRSSNATFARGQGSFKPAKDLRPKKPADVNPDLEKDFEKLGIESYETPTPKGQGHTGSATHESDGREEYGIYAIRGSAKRRRYGRAAVLPGKTFFSQRRNSLTDLVNRQATKAKVRAAPKRKVTANGQRPKTAA